MPREDVNIKVSANVAEAIALWKAMEEGPKGMANELENLGKKGKKSGSELDSILKNMIGKWTSIQNGINTATKLMDALTAATLKQQRASGGISVLISDAEIQFGLQANLRGPQLKAASRRVQEAGVQRGVGPVAALETATEFAGIGLSAKAATEAMKALFDFQISARAIAGEAGPQAALAIGKLIRPENLTAAGIATGLRSLRAGFGETPIKPGDLESLAGVAETIRSAIPSITDEQIIGASSALIRSLTPARAATGLQAAALGLSTAAGQPARVAALGKLGLEPGQLDFVGEGFDEVFQLLGERLRDVKPELVNEILEKLVGREGIAAALILSKPETSKFIGGLGDIAATKGVFEEQVAFGASGVGMRLRQAEARRDINLQNEIEVERLILEAQLQGRFAQQAAKGGTTGFFFNTLSSFGLPPELAAAGALAGGLNPLAVGSDVAAQATRNNEAPARRREEMTIRLLQEDGTEIPHEVEGGPSILRVIGGLIPGAF